jgi:hypothetical protein
METATRIDFVSHTTDVVGEGSGSGVQTFVHLTVNFRVNQRGPAHVAGIIVTHDDWVTSQVTLARFQQFDGNAEVWQALLSVSADSLPTITGLSFEYVIFCDDFGGVDQVPRIWNTNGGQRFQIVVA